MTTLVIGCGNELRGDDALGLHLARAAGRRGLVARTCHQLLPELADELVGFARVVFADASLSASVELTAVEPADAGWPIHCATPPGLLALCRQIHGRCPEGWCLHLPGRDFSLGRRLTSEARQSLRQGLEALASL